MKEKERYEIVYFDNDTRWKIIDNKTKQEVGGIDDMIKLLNQQDKRIKELEQENLSLQEQSIRDNQNWIEETTKLKQQLSEKEKEIEQYKETIKEWVGTKFVKLQNQKAIEQLEKVNGVLTDTIIEVTANEFDIDKLCYLEEISARFYDKMQQQINELKGKDIENRSET